MAALVPLAIPLMIAGTAASAGMAVIGGIQQSNAANAQAKAAAQNAAFYKELGEVNAQSAINTAAAEERRYRAESARRMAVAQTQLGASGAMMSGTPLALLGDANALAEENARLIRYGGQMDAQRARLGASVESNQQSFASSMYKRQAGASLLGGFGSAVGTSLSGLGTIGAMQYQQSGGGMFA